MALHNPQGTTEGEVVASLNNIFGENILSVGYSSVIAKADQLDVEGKTAALALCASALSDPLSSKNRSIRISAARGIVALLPNSLGTIAVLLKRRVNKHDYEVHFTLFCYLDWAQELPDASSLTNNILLLVEDYLMTIPRATARAVWMAADMLGAHWNEQEAVPILVRVSQGAKHSVGRQGGILGLEKVLDRLPNRSDTQKHLLKTLRKISSSDHSKYVREDARMLLQQWQKPLKE